MERSHEFDVGADELWEAVTDPSQLADWLGDEVDIDVSPGGEGRVVDDGELRHVLVDEVDPGRRFTFTWWPHHDRADRSYVEIEVAPADSGSRLVVRETRLAAPDARWPVRLTMLQMRCSMLSPRRTVAFPGDAEHAAGTAVLVRA
jgi:uncharacterized protein YndB with AHSA1/START domain